MKPLMPTGLDQQGRYPTRLPIGADDEDAGRCMPGAGVFLWPLAILAVVATWALLSAIFTH